ncbi:hypothetical protein [Vibrio sp.]
MNTSPVISRCFWGTVVEWYVSALIRAVQTREGSAGGYHSETGSVTLW